MKPTSYRKYLIISLLLGLGGIILGLVVRGNYFNSFDLFVSRFLQTIQPVWFILFNKTISLFELGVIFIVLPVIFLLLKKKKRKEAFYILIAGLSWFLMRFLKTIFNIPCPTPDDIIAIFPLKGLSSSLNQTLGKYPLFSTSVCYPSGHVINYVTVWGMLFYLRESITKNKLIQKIIIIFTIILIMFVGVSRISLGAHWFTDVIGGYLFGFSWLFLLIYFYKNTK